METSPDLSPALYSCAFTREELVSYYSLRGLPIADIISLLFEVHGYRIRYNNYYCVTATDLYTVCSPVDEEATPVVYT